MSTQQQRPQPSAWMSIYVVELSVFEQLLEGTVGALLWQYAGLPSEADLPALSCEASDTRVRYFSRPGQGLSYSNGDKVVTLPPPVTEHIHALNVSLFDYLSEASSEALWQILHCFGIASSEWCKVVSERERTSWVGALLAHVATLAGTEDDLLRDNEILFQRLLRGAACGWMMRAEAPPLAEIHLPITPADERSYTVGSWTAPEFAYFQQTLDWVGGQGLPIFETPDDARQDRAGLAPTTDEQWTAWVITQIEQLYSAGSHGFATPLLLAFVES